MNELKVLCENCGRKMTLRPKVARFCTADCKRRAELSAVVGTATSWQGLTRAQLSEQAIAAE